MKILLLFLLTLLPVVQDTTEYKKIYSEPLYITQDIDGTFTFDLSQVDPEVKVLFIVPIKVECKKDTIIIRPGFKKF